MATTSYEGPLEARDPRVWMTVIGNVAVAPGVRLLSVAAPSPWPFVPGQVVELASAPGTEGYFAIASAPSETAATGRLEFLVKAEGSDSEPLMRAVVSEAIRVNGPYGRGFDTSPATAAPHRLRAPLLFVTAGTAIAAVRSAVVELLAIAPARSVAIAIGVRDLVDLPFTRELVAWQMRGVRVRIAVSRGPIGATPLPCARGRVQMHVADLVTRDVRAFVAGSEELEDDVTRALVAAGVDPALIQRNYRPDERPQGIA